MLDKYRIPGPPTTWTQFIKDAEKITALGKGIYGTSIDPSDNTDPWKIIWAVSAQQGGRLLSQNGKTVEIDSAININAMQFYFDWYTKYHIVPPQSLTWVNSQEIAAFATGNIGMAPGTTANIAALLTEPTIKGKFNFAPMPSVPYGMTARPKAGVPAETPVSGQFDVIAKYANTQLALDYLKIATSPAVQFYQYQTQGALPSVVSADHHVEQVDPRAKPFIAAQLNADATPFTPAFGDIEVALDAALPKIAAKVATSGAVSRAFIANVMTAENKAAQQEFNSVG
jgi:multiple sugar transport system substrate-binding protein